MNFMRATVKRALDEPISEAMQNRRPDNAWCLYVSSCVIHAALVL